MIWSYITNKIDLAIADRCVVKKVMEEKEATIGLIPDLLFTHRESVKSTVELACVLINHLQRYIWNLSVICYAPLPDDFSRNLRRC